MSHPSAPNTSTGPPMSHPSAPNISGGLAYSRYKHIFEAAQAGRWDWDPNDYPDALRATHPASGKTVLHIAVEAGRVDIVRKLVQLMDPDDLKITATTDKRTAFATAAIKGITEMAESMVTKNEELLRLADKHDMLPIELAYLYGHWPMAQYLYSKTPPEKLMPENGPHGAIILCNCFASKEFDISWKLINRSPKLAFTRGRGERTPLDILAMQQASFPSGVELNFWQQWIYDSKDIQPHRNNHTSVTVEENSQANNGRSSIRSVRGLVEQLVSHSKKQKEGLVSKIVEMLGIKRIYEMKIVHVHSLEFLKFMCEEIKKDLDMKQISYGTLRSAIFHAVRKGNVEFITHICKANPALLLSRDFKSSGIFDIAIQCRQEKIYNLIYGIPSKEVIHGGDKYNNNKLHMVGLLSSSAKTQLNRIPGAALQMQRELQWYKEVEELVPPKFREQRNKDKKLTPRELFTKNHSGLLKEGEKWMKEAATSYIIVGALIFTIMFAAVITIPGGNRDTGFPAFIDEKLFKLFIMSDAISLFSSTSATLTFLGILTARFTEDDFLKSLPTKMIIGLATLFLAIATMMIAFSAAFLIIVRGQSWIVIPTILLSSVPVTLFVWMQFPLLARITASTYGRGIFNRNEERWL